ncbi:hypothetical protein KIN20_033100 [Parelaphostrongylus tenuis]|uniref:Uncharacterized protein n=1 Tax=Parelaphostrongylus tenuis TaxID=148309 RepID=A0AAD5WI53_PARTN|nr:hypothetical protein KIN20_033100 [Parelaphostrongylus tenuis]
MAQPAVGPPMSQKPPHVNDYGRSELKFLVDNVVRDLSSFDIHIHLLDSYIKNIQKKL